MKANLKPATAKARVLLKKLQALAERGIDGEKAAAQKKLARLKARLDFTAPDPAETPDLFLGTFKRSTKARWIHTFQRHDFDVANSVKWAIESATQIPCVYRDGELLAEATPGTANRLAEVATHIAGSFRALLDQFSAVDGVSPEDRGVFVMGLYDGMMNEVRNVGQRLPSPARPEEIAREEEAPREPRRRPPCPPIHRRFKPGQTNPLFGAVGTDRRRIARGYAKTAESEGNRKLRPQPARAEASGGGFVGLAPRPGPDGNHVERVDDVQQAAGMFDDDIVMANQDELRMRHGKLLAV